MSAQLEIAGRVVVVVTDTAVQETLGLAVRDSPVWTHAELKSGSETSVTTSHHHPLKGSEPAEYDGDYLRVWLHDDVGRMWTLRFHAADREHVTLERVWLTPMPDIGPVGKSHGMERVYLLPPRSYPCAECGQPPHDPAFFGLL